MGHFAGETIGKKVFETLKEKADLFEVETHGRENLEKLKGKSYLVVANHLKPKETAAQMTGVSPDAFVLSNAVQETNEQELKIINKSDDGWRAEGVYKHVQNFLKPLGKGFSEGMGTIPIYKNPGSFNREFLKAVEQAVADGKPILIFPEGDWYEDFDPSHTLQTGAAHLAKKFGLEIVPAYIRGATSWENKGQVVRVAFGESFAPGDEEKKEEITQRIHDALVKLQEETVAEIEKEYTKTP